ncbi:hypothetical protein ACSBR2_033774 [Camellia fascicularis]
MEGEEMNWSESVEDLVHGGQVDEAITLLESLISKLETLNSSQLDHLQLSSALFDLAKLYSTKGFSLKADQARSRSLLVREQWSHDSNSRDLKNAKEDLGKNCVALYEASSGDGSLNDDGHCGTSSTLPDSALPHKECPDDDWEAIADRAPEELLSPQCLPEVSKLSLEDAKTQTPKRRGRGMFAYTTHGMYSDQQSDGSVVDNSENEAVCDSSEGDRQIRNVRILDEDDILLSSIPPKDLEPPRQRPATSTRTARRLIAQGMGIKLPSTKFGSRELKKQEEARRNRIVSRQSMRDDAWGSDAN